MINTIFFMLLIPLQILCKNLDVNHININNNNKSNNETNINSTIPSTILLAEEQRNFQSYQPYEKPNELNKINYNLLNKVDGRFRRSSQDLLSSTSASSSDGQPFNWNVLRYYICGSDNQNCISNERLNKLRQNQNALKNLLPKNMEITIPTSLQQQQQQQQSPIDWTSSGFHIPPEYLNDKNQWNSLNLSGKREGTLYVEEPDYVLVKGNKNNDELQQHLGPDYNDDPFIPQRGKKEHRKQLDGKKNPIENNSDMINSYPSSYRRSRTKMTTPITDDLNQWKNILLKNKLMASNDAVATHFGKYKKLLIPNDIVTKNTQCCNENDNFYKTNNNNNNNNNNNKNNNNNNQDMMLMAINDDGEVEQLIPTNNNNNYYKNEDNFNTIMQNKRNLLNNNLSHENRDTFYLTRGRNRFRKE